MVLDAGKLTDEEVEALGTMSPDARKQFVDEFVAKYPTAYKYVAGFCAMKKNHVKERECIACATGQGYKTTAEWDMCRGRNLSRP